MWESLPAIFTFVYKTFIFAHAFPLVGVAGA